MIATQTQLNIVTMISICASSNAHNRDLDLLSTATRANAAIGKAIINFELREEAEPGFGALLRVEEEALLAFAAEDDEFGCLLSTAA